jgi:hypothetical protein
MHEPSVFSEASNLTPSRLLKIEDPTSPLHMERGWQKPRQLGSWRGEVVTCG